MEERARKVPCLMLGRQELVSLAFEPYCLKARPVFPPKAYTLVRQHFIKLGVPLLSSQLAGQREVLGDLCLVMHSSPPSPPTLGGDGFPV